jgi:hypothetical protein
MPAASVVESIERAIYTVARSIMAGAGRRLRCGAGEALRLTHPLCGSGRGFHYLVPSRANSNQLYVKELDRIVLKDNLTSRDFNDQSQARGALVVARAGPCVLASGTHAAWHR